MRYWICIVGALVVAPVLAWTDFRFSKDYRHGITRYHRAVYAVIGTVAANGFADALQPWFDAGRNRLEVAK